MPEIMTEERWQQIGTRLKELREQKELEQWEVAQELSQRSPGGYTATQVGFWELGWPIPSSAIILLSQILDCQIRYLLSGPLLYETPEAWISAYIRGEVTEGTLASEGLHCDRLEARTQVEQFHERR